MGPGQEDGPLPIRAAVPGGGGEEVRGQHDAVRPQGVDRGVQRAAHQGLLLEEEHGVVPAAEEMLHQRGGQCVGERLGAGRAERTYQQVRPVEVRERERRPQGGVAGGGARSVARRLKKGTTGCSAPQDRATTSPDGICGHEAMVQAQTSTLQTIRVPGEHRPRGRFSIVPVPFSTLWLWTNARSRSGS